MKDECRALLSMIRRQAGDWLLERPNPAKPQPRFYWGGNKSEPASPSTPAPQSTDGSTSPWQSGRKPRDANGDYLYTDANGRGLYEPGEPVPPPPVPEPEPEPEPEPAPELTEWSFTVRCEPDQFDVESFSRSCAQVNTSCSQLLICAHCGVR